MRNTININAQNMVDQLTALRAQFVDLFTSDNGTVNRLTHEKPLQLIDQCIADWKKEANQPLPQNEIDVDALSNFIRKVDGNNSMGAGILAEQIAGWITEQTELAQQLQLNQTINVLTKLHTDIKAAGYKAWTAELHGRILSYRDVLTMVDQAINEQKTQLKGETATSVPEKIDVKTVAPQHADKAEVLGLLKYLHGDIGSSSTTVNLTNVRYVAVGDIDLAFEKAIEKVQLTRTQSIASSRYEPVQGVVLVDGLPALVKNGQEASYCNGNGAVRLYKEKVND